MTTKVAAALAVASFVCASPAFADKPVELAPTELAAIQAHSYPVPSGVAFGAVVAALQTQGYMDIQASKDAGTVSGVTEAKAKIIYNILWGFGKKKLTQKAALLVEDLPGGRSNVRLNLLVSETKARGIFGTSFSDGKMVKTAEPYQEFFHALDAEVATRVATMAPPAPAPVLAPAATAVASEAAPAAAPTVAPAVAPAAAPQADAPKK